GTRRRLWRKTWTPSQFHQAPCRFHQAPWLTTKSNPLWSSCCKSSVFTFARRKRLSSPIRLCAGNSDAARARAFGLDYIVTASADGTDSQISRSARRSEVDRRRLVDQLAPRRVLPTTMTPQLNSFGRTRVEDRLFGRWSRIEKFGQSNFDTNIVLEPAYRVEIVEDATGDEKILGK